MSAISSWASLELPVERGDWVGCAEALAAHGLPPAHPTWQPDSGIVDGRRMRFSEEGRLPLLASAGPGPRPDR